ncbi:MAG: hypothetical protein KAY37_08480 [Phycisphaerae bacterium]|nr:hypothetical protein [Phycisphaerae bacterium]
MRVVETVTLCAVLFLGIGIVGCDCTQHITMLEPDGKDADLIRTTYRAVDCLLCRMPGKTSIDPDRRMLVATVVNLDAVNDTSSFGRLIGEFIAGRLAQQGYSVVHLTVRQGSVAINDSGQFLLSRDVKKLAKDHNTGSVLVSTYTLTPDKVYLSLKLVNVEANTLVAAVDLVVPKGPRTSALLGGSTASSSIIGPYYEDRWHRK